MRAAHTPLMRAVIARELYAFDAARVGCRFDFFAI